jgi:NADH-quinone oxidoreductase subunit C
MSIDIEAIARRIREALPGAGISVRKNPGPSGQHSLLIDPSNLIEVCRFLRDTPGLEFDFLSNVTGIDWPDAAKADTIAVAEGEGIPASGGMLEVVYHLYSTILRTGPLVLRARTLDREKNIQIPSIISVFRSADFQEREIFDLYGVEFTGHPDLRRILMWDEFVDHPMRKDYIAPDDYEYEPTPHEEVLEKAKKHYPVP